MIHLVIPDQHAHFQFHNQRAEWLGRLIVDIKPDVVINLGDAADMPSLSDHDKGKKAFEGRTYKADIEAHLDFQYRMWAPVWKQKKKRPRTVFIEGNHEHRIVKAIENEPRLEGAIGLHDLRIEEFYDEFVQYRGNTPGSIEISGITYSHFFTPTGSDRAISGLHHAYSLLTKKYASATCGHAHILDFCQHRTVAGNWILGLCSGCYQDYDAPWAGSSNDHWWRGVVIKRNVEAGGYSPQFVSLAEIEREYGDG